MNKKSFASDEVTVEVLRTLNYNTVKISINYTYTGDNPSGFTDKEIDQLVQNTMNRGDIALEKLKTRLNIPLTVKQ